jgi:ABC-type phosphate/phosphonate transport system permease subunit
MKPVKEPKIYRDPDRTKILWFGILVALVVLAAIALATMSLNRTMKSTGAFTGKIIAKEFTPEPAQEITVGQGGLQSTRVEGEYKLQVETPDRAKVFNVWVDRTVYEESEVGDDYYVIPSL